MSSSTANRTSILGRGAPVMESRTSTTIEVIAVMVSTMTRPVVTLTARSFGDGWLGCAGWAGDSPPRHDASPAAVPRTTLSSSVVIGRFFTLLMTPAASENVTCRTVKRPIPETRGAFPASASVGCDRRLLSSPDVARAPELHEERVPAWRAPFAPDRPTLRLDGETAERQPESGRFVAASAPQSLRAVWLEDSGSLFRRKRWPIVGDPDRYALLRTRDDDAHLPIDGRDLRCVTHEVLDDASCELGIAVAHRIAARFDGDVARRMVVADG